MNTPVRWSMVMGALAGLALQTASGPVVAASPAADRDLSGVWRVRNDQVGLFSSQLPTLTAEGAALFKARQAAAKAGDSADPSFDCTALGFPRNMYTRFPVQIVQTDGQILELFPTSQRTRRIFIDGRPQDAENLDNFGPLYNGYAIGRWTEGAWVVETIGLKETTWIDASGIPKSPDMKVTERLRRTGDRLEIEMTIEDPRMLAQPWQTTKVYERVTDEDIPETNCRKEIATALDWASRKR